MNAGVVRAIFGSLCGALVAIGLFLLWGFPQEWYGWLAYTLSLFASLVFFEYVWPRWRRRPE